MVLAENLWAIVEVSVVQNWLVGFFEVWEGSKNEGVKNPVFPFIASVLHGVPNRSICFDVYLEFTQAGKQNEVNDTPSSCVQLHWPRLNTPRLSRR